MDLNKRKVTTLDALEQEMGEMFARYQRASDKDEEMVWLEKYTALQTKWCGRMNDVLDHFDDNDPIEQAQKKELERKVSKMATATIGNRNIVDSYKQHKGIKDDG